jgi:xanthine dehydrogenase accessory factor
LSDIIGIMSANVQSLLEEIVQRGDAGERLMLCTVVSTRGSCPQSPGARMLVLGDGKTLGTLGGGCVEAEVRSRAVEMLTHAKSALLEFTLDHDYGWDDGLICGGVMDVFVQTIDAEQIEAMRQSLASIRAGNAATIRITYEKGGEAKEYLETIDPVPALLIAGAGHVAQALAQIAPPLGFRVTVIDDRPDYASQERFPTVEQRIIGEIDSELSRFPIDAKTFVVIVTRGHQRDGQALRAVIDSPARYIGLIGSKRKIKAIYDDLAEQGVAIEKLLRVHAPIGYEIGATTVPEIAVSIAAELVSVRRRGEGAAARPMKIDEEQIRAWLSRGVSSRA